LQSIYNEGEAAGALGEAGDVGGAGLIDAQAFVKQQLHHGRGAKRLGAGGGDQGPGWSRSRPTVAV
jgi:hypothetical protein